MKYPTKYWKFTKDASGQIKKELVEKDGSIDYTQQIKTKTLWYEYYKEPSSSFKQKAVKKPATKAQKTIRKILIGIFIAVVSTLLAWWIIKQLS